MLVKRARAVSEVALENKDNLDHFGTTSASHLYKSMCIVEFDPTLNKDKD